MAVLKNKTQGNFVIVSQNITKDRLLSLTERGLLLTLLSLPDGWNLSVAGLQKILPDGKDKISHALNKLIDYGYVTREQERGGNGKFGTNILEVHEEPVRDEDNPFSDGDSISKPLAEKPSAGNPSSVKPQTDKPSAENLQQYSNKYISNQKESNKRSSNKKRVAVSRAEEANPSDTLSEDDYQSLVNDFGKELVDYTISRIRENHYKGCMNYSTVYKWCSEYKARNPVKKPGNGKSKVHDYNERSYSADFFDSLMRDITETRACI